MGIILWRGEPLIAVLLGLVIFAFLSTAHAGWGVRAGVTDDPDTFFLGVHGQVSVGGRMIVEPSAELGFDDNIVTIRGNGNFKVPFVVGSGVNIYPLAGIAIYYVNVDCGRGDCDNTEVGANLGGGVSFGGFAFDLAFGLSDIPDLTLTGSYSF